MNLLENTELYNFERVNFMARELYLNNAVVKKKTCMKETVGNVESGNS